MYGEIDWGMDYYAPWIIKGGNVLLGIRGIGGEVRKEKAS